MIEPISFLSFELDIDVGELRQDGSVMALTRQQFSLLVYLVSHRDRVVGREELAGAVWEGIRVGEGSVRQAISDLRRRLQDSSDTPKIISTHRGRGYRFIAPAGPLVRAHSPLVPRADPHIPPGGVGRLAEFSLLLALRRDSCEEAGRTCLILGPSGVGKSHLARALLADRAGPENIVGHAQCQREASLPPCSIWNQLLFDVASRLPAPAPLLVQIEGLRASASSTLRSASTDGQQRCYIVAEEVARILSALSRIRPLVLCMDDVHWLDGYSSYVLRHIVQRLSESRVLLLLTARSYGGTEPALQALHEALVRGPLNRRLDLENLSQGELGELLRLYRGIESTCRVAAIHRLTGGNPLFALEVARDGERAPKEDSEPSPPTEESAPSALWPACPEASPGVVSLMRDRLRELPEHVGRVVAAASTLGHTFGLGALAAMLGTTAADVLLALDGAAQAGLVIARGPLEFEFAHPLFHEATYAGMPGAQRAQLHRLAGEAIERLKPEPCVDDLYALARHFYCAAAVGAADKAVVYSRRCAECALAGAAFEDAQAHYDRALECAELSSRVGAAVRLELEMGKAQARRASGEHSPALDEHFLELSRRADAAGDATLLARAALGYVGHLEARFQPASFALETNAAGRALIERALARQAATPSVLRVLLLCSLVYVSSGLATEQALEGLLEQAEHEAQTLGLPWLRIRVWAQRFYLLSGPRRLQEHAAWADQWVDLAERHGLLEAELEARMAQAYCALCLVDRQKAQRAADRACHLAEKLGTDAARGWALQWSLWVALLDGRIDAASALSEESLRCMGQDPNFLFAYGALQGYIDLLREGAWDSLILVNEVALRAYPRYDTAHAALAAAYAAVGRYDEARTEFDRAIDLQPSRPVWLTHYAALADAAWGLGCQRRAELVYAKLSALAGQFVFLGIELIPSAPVDYLLGLLAIVRSDRDAARAHLREALRICDRLHATFAQRLVRVALVELRLRLGDAAACADPLSELHEICVYLQERNLLALQRALRSLFGSDLRRAASGKR